MAILTLKHPKRKLPSLDVSTKSDIESVYRAVNHLLSFQWELQHEGEVFTIEQLQQKETENRAVITEIEEKEAKEEDSDDDDSNKENDTDLALWWANKELIAKTPETTLADFIGANEKTKVVVKIARVCSMKVCTVKRTDSESRKKLAHRLETTRWTSKHRRI